MPAPDYLIVGAGSAGAVLAARLSENPAVVVHLVEAGPDYRSSETPEAMAAPNPHEIIDDPAHSRYRWDDLDARRAAGQDPYTYWRGRGTGGSSAINGQIAIRPTVEDLDGWEAEGCTGWNHATLLPSLNRLESDERYGHLPHHGDDGPIPIHRAPLSRWGPVDLALAEAGLDAGHRWCPDHNAPGSTGLSPYAINSRNGRRVSTNDGYLEPARDRPNLTVSGGVLVDRVVIERGRASGVVAIVDGRERVLAAGTVILSAGAVHSPAILQRSGVGPASALAGLGIGVVADLPVGHGLQDHPAAFVPIALEPWADSPPGFRHTNACIRYSSGLDGAGPNDMMVVSLNRLGDSLGSAATPAPGQVRNTTGVSWGLLGVWVNQCRSRGTVGIVSTSPADHPLVHENLLADDHDLLRLRDGVRRLLDLCDHPSVLALGRVRAPVAPAATDDDLDRWIRATVGDTQHAVGTCRMGAPDDSRTVVDPACAVLGVDGLLVADASILPTIPRANTHLTTVMLAEHLATTLGR